MEAKGKLLKELFESFKSSGNQAVNKSLEEFEKQTGQKVTKDIWDSVFGANKGVTKNIVKEVTKTAPKDAPIVGKALEKLRASQVDTLSAVAPKTSKLPKAPFVDAAPTQSVLPKPEINFANEELVGAKQSLPPSTSSTTTTAAPSASSTSVAPTPPAVPAIEGATTVAAAAAGVPPKTGSAKGAIMAGTVAGAIPSMTGEDSPSSAPPLPTKLAALTSASRAVAASAGPTTSADVTPPEAAKPKPATRAVTYKPDDVKAMLREVDKTPFSYDISKEERAVFQKTRDSIADRQADLFTEYKADLKAAKDEQQRKDTITNYAAAFERIGLALTTFFAAKKGMEMGQDISKGVRDLRPTDWMEMTKQHMAEYDNSRKLAKEGLDIQSSPLDDQLKLTNSQEKTSSENAFSRGREEAKRRNDIAGDNQVATNKISEFNAKETNDARQKGVDAQNILNNQTSQNEFNAAQQNLNRGSRETIADTRADATMGAAELRVSNAMGLGRGHGKESEQDKKNRATAVAAFNTLSDNKNDKTVEFKLVQSMLLLGKTPEEAQKAVAEAKKGAIGHLFGGDNKPAVVQSIMSGATPSATPSAAPISSAAPTTMQAPGGATAVVSDPAKVQQLKAAGWKIL